MKVEDVMNRELEYIEPNASVREAIDRMLKKGMRSLVVKPKDEMDTYGVVTVRDIVFGVFANGLDPNDVKVADIASKPVVCVDKSVDVGLALRLMKRFNIARVFVFEEGKIVGIVTLMDLMRVYSKSKSITRTFDEEF